MKFTTTSLISLPRSLQRAVTKTNSNSIPIRYLATMLSSDDWVAHVPSKPSIPAYKAFTKSILKPPLDDREYRIIRLQNGLTATLVHDPTADKAAASLDVAVGHLHDPVSAKTIIGYFQVGF